VSGVEQSSLSTGRFPRPEASRIEHVSIIVPMLDEEARVDGLVADIAAQKFVGELELLVADGGSRDRSVERLREAARRHGLELTLVENRDRLIPHGLNACVRRARGDLIVRMDCRGHYSHDYIQRCIAAAEETGAWNVGGLTVPVGRSRMGRAAACATDSPFGGIGWTRHAAGGRDEVDTVYGGAYRRDAFEQVGLFDGSLPRNDDEDFNFRLRRAGGRVILDPQIKIFYSSRDSAAELFSQYSGYGRGKVDLMMKHKRPMSLRSLIPLTFVGSLAALTHAFCRPSLPSFPYFTSVTASACSAKSRPSLPASRHLPLLFALVRELRRPCRLIRMRSEVPAEPEPRARGRRRSPTRLDRGRRKKPWLRFVHSSFP
jgi:succinoglycan biosynthesis protein ExoA